LWLTYLAQVSIRDHHLAHRRGIQKQTVKGYAENLRHIVGPADFISTHIVVLSQAPESITPIGYDSLLLFGFAIPCFQKNLVKSHHAHAVLLRLKTLTLAPGTIVMIHSGAKDS
jgi:hypothetical protein